MIRHVICRINLSSLTFHGAEILTTTKIKIEYVEIAMVYQKTEDGNYTNANLIKSLKREIVLAM